MQHVASQMSKACFQHIATAAGINLVRIMASLEGISLAKIRQSHFSRLMAQLDKSLVTAFSLVGLPTTLYPVAVPIAKSA